MNYSASPASAVPRSLPVALAPAAARRAIARSGASQCVILGATCIVFGILWDISWHRTIGRDTFWTPAHLAIYLGGLVAGLTGGYLILTATFANAGADGEGVRIWGFRGPLGAWIWAWGAAA